MHDHATNFAPPCSSLYRPPSLYFDDPHSCLSVSRSRPGTTTCSQLFQRITMTSAYRSILCHVDLCCTAQRACVASLPLCHAVAAAPLRRICTSSCSSAEYSAAAELGKEEQARVNDLAKKMLPQHPKKPVRTEAELVAAAQRSKEHSRKCMKAHRELAASTRLRLDMRCAAGCNSMCVPQAVHQWRGKS